MEDYPTDTPLLSTLKRVLDIVKDKKELRRSESLDGIVMKSVNVSIYGFYLSMMPAFPESPLVKCTPGPLGSFVVSSSSISVIISRMRNSWHMMKAGI